MQGGKVGGMQYVFGAFTLDTEQYELRCAGEAVPLEPKAYQVLAYLVQHRDRLVTGSELLTQAWPDVAVDRLAVARCISSIRRAVGDSAETQQTIQTRRGHGYRFVAEVQETASISTEDSGTAQAAEQVCASCQHHNPSSARFCMACGSPLSTVCPACTHVVQVPANFCPACGQPLRPTPVREVPQAASQDESPATRTLHAEHKVVSICYALPSFVSGASEPLDREVLHDLQQVMERIVAEVIRPYGGELYELDSHHMALLVFGVPEAMEDHAQRAVFGALAILQHEVDAPSQPGAEHPARLTWQIGIHSGPVVVGPSASGLQRGMSMSGDVRKGAEALASQAEAGALLLSEATSRWLQDIVRLEPTAPVSISGLPAPLAAFRVLWQQAVQSVWATRTMRHHTRFVGREAERQRLHHHLNLAFEGRGQIVSLVGEPGIGKTRLLSEFVRLERDRAITYLIGSCHAYGQNTPYFPMMALVRQQCMRYRMSAQEHLRDPLERMLQSLNMATEGHLATLVHLLEPPNAVEPSDGLSPQQRREQTFAVLHQLFIRMSQQQPLLLAIDDLHWIDATSLAFLSELAEQIGGAHMLLLVLARPGYQPFWSTTSYVTQLSLSGLTEEEGRDVVQSIGQSTPLAVSTRQQIVAKAQGNPFFLEGLTQAVIEHGHHETIIAVPDTVQAVLSARLDRLPPETKRLLMIAAVIGPEAPLSLLQDMAELPETEIDLHLRRLQTAEFLYVTGYGTDASVVFKHRLTQEVAYQSLLTRHRQQLHQQIAQTWAERFPERVERQPEWLAFHYTEAGLIEQALAYWQLAGKRANERSAYVEAITHLQTGLNLIATLPETAERAQRELALERELASAQIVTQGYTAPEVARVYARMYELCQQLEENVELFPILLELARFDSQRGALHQSRALGERLLAIAVRQQDAVYLQQAHWMLGQTLHYLGDITPAHTHLTQSMSFYVPQSLHTQTGRDLAGVQIASLFFESLNLWALGCPDQALTCSREALALAQELEHPFTLTFAHYGMARIHHLRREPLAVFEQTQALLSLAGDQHFSPYLVRGRALEGWALAQQGQVEAGMNQLQQGLGEQRHEIDAVVHIMFLMLLADTCYQGQQPQIGLEALAEALVAVDEKGLRFHVAELYRLQGELVLQQHALDEKLAESYFQHALEAANHQQAQSWALRTAVSLSRLWQLQGKGDKAHTLLADIYGRFTEGFNTVDLQEAKALLETLA